MKKIIEAGTYAPNAGCGQRTVICGIRNKALVEQLGKLNLSQALTEAASLEALFPENSPAPSTIRP